MEPLQKERTAKMFELGLKWDGESFASHGINFHWTDIVCMDEEKFNSTVSQIEDILKSKPKNMKTKEMAMEMREREQQVPTVAKKSIYNIQGDYLRLMDAIEANEGELTKETEAELAITIEKLEEKAVSYGYCIRQFDFEIAQIVAEQERLNKIMIRKSKIKEVLKTRISEAMLHFNITKVQQNNLTLSFLKSEQLHIDEDAKIPKKYIKVKVTESIDKAGLKADTKSGAIKVEGIFIVENQNLQIK